MKNDTMKNPSTTKAASTAVIALIVTLMLLGPMAMRPAGATEHTAPSNDWLSNASPSDVCDTGDVDPQNPRLEATPMLAIQLNIFASLPCDPAVLDCLDVQCLIDTLGLYGCLTNECLITYFLHTYGVNLVICGDGTMDLQMGGHSDGHPDDDGGVTDVDRTCTMIVFSFEYAGASLPQARR